MNKQDIAEAHKIILYSIKRKKLLVEIKRWELLPYDVREKALRDFGRYRPCECGCREYYNISRMVSQYNSKKQDQSLYFFKHKGDTEESFEMIGWR